MIKKILPAPLLILLVVSACCQSIPGRIRAGEVWKDQEGRPINAHGGGMLFFKGTYYWFGEIKQGKTWLVPASTWEDYRVAAGGISCYSSADLLHWKNEGIALAPDPGDSAGDLHPSRVIERPKVIYNRHTRKFVMWMHIDREDYSLAHAGVAVSDHPAGPYQYLGSLRPNGHESRDMTLYQDEDGKAYLIYASEGNKTMHICLLSEDYLKPTVTDMRILAGENREAPAMFRSGNTYYLITSLCTGWDPNMARYAVADRPLGEWKLMGNPCSGPGADSTYGAQGNFVLPVRGRSDAFIFMADQWKKTNLEDSKYLWLPLHIRDGRPEIQWQDAWNPGEMEKNKGSE